MNLRRVEAISNPCLRSLLANENYWLHCHLILTGFTSASLVTQLPVRRFCYSGPISNWHTVCIVLVRPALVSLAFTASLSLLFTLIGSLMISYKSICIARLKLIINFHHDHRHFQRAIFIL